MNIPMAAGFYPAACTAAGSTGRAGYECHLRPRGLSPNQRENFTAYRLRQRLRVEVNPEVKKLMMKAFAAASRPLRDVRESRQPRNRHASIDAIHQSPSCRCQGRVVTIRARARYR
jgi:hypothetical protein